MHPPSCKIQAGLLCQHKEMKFRGGNDNGTGRNCNGKRLGYADYGKGGRYPGQAWSKLRDDDHLLPGMCAAIFPMPVIGIPMHTTSLGGRDSLYSIVQMPTGIPVATVAINGGANAGILAAKILATSDAALLERLKDYSKNLKEQVEAKDARLKEVGYKNY